jgi:hypothetical protein
MAEIQAILTKKVGPLPLWGWAAGGGGLLAMVYLNKRGASSSTAASAAGQQPNVPYVPSPIIVTPQTMAPGTSSVNPTVPTAAAAATTAPNATVGGIRFGNVGNETSHGYFGGQPPGFLKQLGAFPFGTPVTITGPPVSAQVGDPSRPSTVTFYPIQGPAGTTAYMNTVDLIPSGSGGGMGAGGSVVNLIPKSGAGKVLRFSGRHAHPQFVGVGMGGGGHGQLHQVSAQTGVPVARLMALNPGHWHAHKRRPVAIHIG